MDDVHCVFRLFGASSPCRPCVFAPMSVWLFAGQVSSSEVNGKTVASSGFASVCALGSSNGRSDWRFLPYRSRPLAVGSRPGCKRMAVDCLAVVAGLPFAVSQKRASPWKGS